MEMPTEDAESAVPPDYYSEYVEYRGRTRFSVPMQNFYHRRLLGFARSRLPANPSILEIGFGLGHFAEQVRRAGIPYVALDMSGAVCELARKEGYEIRQGAFPPMPGNLDCNVVWMSHVLEHASSWHHARAMASAAYEGLPDGGLFVVICPDIHSWREYFWMDWSHGYPTSAPRLTQLMRDVGFKSVETRYVTATIHARLPRALLDLLFRFVPVGFLDGLLGAIGMRPYASSFMTLFGWRHIVVFAHRSIPPRAGPSD